MELQKANRICAIKDPLNWTSEKRQFFVDGMREMIQWHYDNNSTIKGLLDKYQFEANSLQTESDISSIPMLGVHGMKYHLLTVDEHDEPIMKLTSSGTRGQKTQMWFDQESMDRAQSMMKVLWEQQELVSDEETNYMMFIYDPNDAKDLGISFSIANQMRFAPVADSYFAIKKDSNGNWKMDFEEIFAKLEQYQAEGKPVRIHGIPVFIHDFMLEMVDRGLSYNFDGGAMLTGGGWKQGEDRKVSKEVFRDRVFSSFGIKQERILDGYGMAEHVAPYMECSHHRFHVPVYCDVIIRNPETREVMKDGEAGLIQLLTPINTMLANFSILTTDIGSLDPEPCPCGYESPTLNLLGRGGLKKHKGCALTASEIVKR